MRSESGVRRGSQPSREGWRMVDREVGGSGEISGGGAGGRQCPGVGMAGRVQRRRGLLVLLDLRTEEQGVAGSQGTKNGHLGFLERGSLILTTTGTNEGEKPPPRPQAPSAPHCQWLLVDRGGRHSLSPASRTAQEALRARRVREHWGWPLIAPLGKRVSGGTVRSSRP